MKRKSHKISFNEEANERLMYCVSDKINELRGQLQLQLILDSSQSMCQHLPR